MMHWNNFEFYNPEFLWLLILIPLLAIWHFFMRKKDTAVLTMPSVKGFKTGSFITKLKPILYLLRLLALAAIIMTTKLPRLRYRVSPQDKINEAGSVKAAPTKTAATPATVVTNNQIHTSHDFSIMFKSSNSIVENGPIFPL